MENASLKRSTANYLPTKGNVIVVLNVMDAEKSNMMMNRIGIRCQEATITIEKNQEQYDTKA
jgi:hypothetical protein|nr:MAG TPA: hypothetical protein [Caudoviricetes sp.]